MRTVTAQKSAAATVGARESGYFGTSQYYRPVPELNEWIRRRLRMCYWKQWRWARTVGGVGPGVGSSRLPDQAAAQRPRKCDACRNRNAAIT